MSDKLTAPLDALIAGLSPAARRSLSREIMMQLRAAQAKRIAEQKNPDGSSYEPRRISPRKRKKQPKVSLKMFNKLRTLRYLKRRHSANVAEVFFAGGRAARIAAIHQRGETVNLGRGIRAAMPARGLLGYPQADIEMIEEIIIKHLSEAA